ncbi:MAG TPA: erythromycin esterase family protein [Lacipirellulaceae bacterium]|nr:erythromycin esterase family protein [Lacipirellulaceae bacterium]
MSHIGSSVELLGLGEALHGGEEILIFRNRLFQRLVEVHGFTAIAIESSFPRGFLVNDYIAGRGPHAYEEIEEAGFGHGFGKVAANRELIEWMRDYNAGSPRGSRLAFYGFDIPGLAGGPTSPRAVLQVAIECLSQVDPGAAARHADLIVRALGDEARWENPMLWRDPAASGELLRDAATLRVATEEVVSELQVKRPALIATCGEQAFLDAMHHAVNARQLLSFFTALATGSNYAASLGVRDATMAENLAFVVTRERTHGKVLAFAHNKHLQRGQAGWQLGDDLLTWWPAGAHMARTMGPRYAVIGTAVGVSEGNGIAAPEPGTWEARLTASPGPIRLVPLADCPTVDPSAPATDGAATAGKTPLPERGRSRANPTYFPLNSQTPTDFDWVAAFDEVTYSRGGPPLASR